MRITVQKVFVKPIHEGIHNCHVRLCLYIYSISGLI